MSSDETEHETPAGTGDGLGSPRPSSPRTALVVGATGITGTALVERLTGDGWDVVALSRRGLDTPGVTSVRADLTDADALRTALAGQRPTHVFLTAWSRRETEAENIVVNKAMVADLLAAVEHAPVEHVALVTGLKHYLGPFEAYGKGDMPDTPFRESEPRLPYPNFYYAQEDALFEAAARSGFSWSVHRSHTVIGYAVGNAMNMALTLAAAATLSREDGRPFAFPGSRTQWDSLVDMTDASLLADHMVWASTEPAGANEAFNVVNGDIFRWRRMWPRIAELLGVDPSLVEGFGDEARPLEQQMAGAEDDWRRIAERHDLAEPELDRVASWWHTDADLGREMEVVTDMTKSRLAGFTGYRSTEESFARTFRRYRDGGLVPA